LDELEALTRRLKRERAARQEAEALLEEKSRDLYDAKDEADRLTEELRKTVGYRSQELLNAQRVAKVGTFIWDIEGEIVTWSDGVYSILGVDPESEALSAERYFSAILDEDRLRVSAQVERARGAGFSLGSEHATLHRIKRPDGEIRWIKGLGKIAQLGGGGSLYLSAAIQDITELKAADSQIILAQQQLKQRLGELESTQKFLEKARAEAENANHTKSRFIAMISHEIRTPINGLLGTLSLLSDSKLNDTQDELVQVASKSGETLRLLLNDVIDFSRLETGDIQLEPTDFSLRELAKWLIDFWRPQADSKGNQVVLQIDPELPDKLFGDSTRIGQILNNLVSNSIKFTSNGSITVRIRSEEKPSAHSPKCLLRVEVSDTGIGIAEENVPKLFKEFSQLSNARETQNRFYDSSSKEHGAGLGLAICSSLVDRMGGRINLTSVLGEGSTFFVHLPLEYSGTKTKKNGEKTELRSLTNQRGKKPRALLVEDVPANQLVARMLLEKFGCVVDIANDGIEAVDSCKSRSYDFVLMDVSMPRMDGVDATLQIRALPSPSVSAVPIIGLTAFAFSDEWNRFYEAGMNAVVSKPIQRDILYADIKAALGSDEITKNDPTVKKSRRDMNFETLQALTKGFSEEQAERVFEQVSNDLDERCRIAIESAECGNLEELGRSCHAIKGLAASFGGEVLAELAGRVEGLVNDGASDQAVATALEGFGPATDKVLLALADYAGRLTVGDSGE